jgi:hypothetical protein
MRNAPEVVREVGIDDFRWPPSTLTTACWAFRPGRYAYCSGGRSASKIGSSTSIVAVMQTRSRKVEMPSGLSLPVAFGMNTLLIGSDGGRNELILGAPWTTQSKPAELQDALQVCEPHLDLLPLTSRLLKTLGTSERPGDVSGVLMDIAWDLA